MLANSAAITWLAGMMENEDVSWTAAFGLVWFGLVWFGLVWLGTVVQILLALFCIQPTFRRHHGSPQVFSIRTK